MSNKPKQTNFFKLLIARGRTKFNLILGGLLLIYTVGAALDPVLAQDLTSQVPPLYMHLAGAVGLLLNWWINTRDNFSWDKFLADLPGLIEVMVERVQDAKKPTDKRELVPDDYDPATDMADALKTHKLL